MQIELLLIASDLQSEILATASRNWQTKVISSLDTSYIIV